VKERAEGLVRNRPADSNSAGPNQAPNPKEK
jgi:hypothetical protein